MVSIKCLLPLAGLIVAALSAEIARFDPDLATMTALPRDVMVNPFEAEPTPPPHGRFAVMALKRQISPTCGYFETATPTETTSPVPSGPPVGAIVGGVVGGVALLGAIITAVIWMLARKRQKGRNNNSNGNPDGMAPGVSQHFPHNGMGYSGAPMEAQLSRQTTGFDASKGNYQSTVTPAGVGQSIQHHHGYSHPMPAPSIMSTSTAGPYQPPVSAIPQSPEAAPMYNAVHNGHAMQYTSEVPAINKAGTGNNASELPSPNYR
ncbi:hypothetical protein ColKHC_09833 [Colletotrichum higginsianum]|nr:hypothetical protein ColKHC_09833 [Colletotrichum higginsianum]